MHNPHDKAEILPISETLIGPPLGPAPVAYRQASPNVSTFHPSLFALHLSIRAALQACVKVAGTSHPPCTRCSRGPVLCTTAHEVRFGVARAMLQAGVPAVPAYSVQT